MQSMLEENRVIASILSIICWLISYESHATRTCMRTVWYATSRRDLSERWRRYQTGRNR